MLVREISVQCGKQWVKKEIQLWCGCTDEYFLLFHWQWVGAFSLRTLISKCQLALFSLSYPRRGRNPLIFLCGCFWWNFFFIIKLAVLFSNCDFVFLLNSAQTWKLCSSLVFTTSNAFCVAKNLLISLGIDCLSLEKCPSLTI